MYDTTGLEHWILSSNANSCASAQNIAAENESVTLAEHVTYWQTYLLTYLFTYLLTYLTLLLVIQRRGHTTKNSTPGDAMMGDTNLAERWYN